MTATNTVKKPSAELLQKYVIGTEAVDATAVVDMLTTWLVDGDPSSPEFEELVKKTEEAGLLKPGLLEAVRGAKAMKPTPTPAPEPEEEKAEDEPAAEEPAKPKTKRGRKPKAEKPEKPPKEPKPKKEPKAKKPKVEKPPKAPRKRRIPKAINGIPTLAALLEAKGDTEVKVSWPDAYAAKLSHDILARHGFKTEVDSRVPGGTLEPHGRKVTQTIQVRHRRDAVFGSRKKGVVGRFIERFVKEFQDSADGLIASIVMRSDQDPVKMESLPEPEMQEGESAPETE
jgi:hypothetical protein